MTAPKLGSFSGGKFLWQTTRIRWNKFDTYPRRESLPCNWKVSFRKKIFLFHQLSQFNYWFESSLFLVCAQSYNTLALLIRQVLARDSKINYTLPSPPQLLSPFLSWGFWMTSWRPNPWLSCFELLTGPGSLWKLKWDLLIFWDSAQATECAWFA